MASYTIEKLPAEPIILGIVNETWRAETDISPWAEELYQMLDSVGEPVFYIANLLESNPWTLDETIRTASAVARGPRAILHHPNMKEVLIVTNQALINLGAKGLHSEIFGNVRVKIYSKLEEAFDYARLH